MNPLDSFNLISLPELLRRTTWVRRTVYKWIDTAHFPRPMKIGRKVYFRVGAVEEWMHAQNNPEMDAAEKILNSVSEMVSCERPRRARQGTRRKVAG